jgi:hypothetical protein
MPADDAGEVADLLGDLVGAAVVVLVAVVGLRVVGHLSTGSRMPSPSVSGIGQPSGSTPGTSGHLSTLSRKPSPSRSFSGQPSGAMPGTSGHLSWLSMKPSPSRSRSGQPSGAMPGSYGQASLGLSRKPSPSLSFGGLGSGASCGRAREGEAEQDLGVVGGAGVDAVAGGDDVADVEAQHQAVGDVDLDAAAEVRRLGSTSLPRAPVVPMRPPLPRPRRGRSARTGSGR